MFRASSVPPPKQEKSPEPKKSLFGGRTVAPRLESAFIFPASERPRGVSIDGGRKIEKPISKKS